MQNMKTSVVSIGPFNKICRICLQESERQRNIFGPPNGQPAEHLRYVTDLKVGDSDGLPQQLCERCLSRLRDAAALKRKAIASHSMLGLLAGVSAQVGGGPHNKDAPTSTVKSVGDKEMAKTMIKLVGEIGMDMAVVKEEPQDLDDVEVKNEDHESSEQFIPVEADESLIQQLQEYEDGDVIKYELVEDEVDPGELNSSYVEDDGSIIVEEKINDQGEIVEQIIDCDSQDDETLLNDYIIDESAQISEESMIIEDEDDMIEIDEEYRAISDLLQGVSDKGDTASELRETDIVLPTVEYIMPVDDGTVPKNISKKKQKVVIDGKKVIVDSPTIKVYACDTCSYQTDMRHKLTTHMKRHMNKLDFKCQYEGCNSAFLSQGLLTVHERKHTREKLPTCEVCSKTFINKVGLMNHMSYIHKGLKRFLCSECPTMLASATSLRQHMSIHKGTRNYLCDECGKRFRMGKALQSHMETHTEQRQYSCPNCDKTFKQKSVLQKHVRVVHTEASRNKFTCETCGRRFPYPYLLHHHTTVAHPDNLHVCEVCSCRFLASEELEQHMTFHEKPGERQCSQCLRVFDKEDDLENHECKSSKSNYYYCHRCHISVQGAHLFDIHNRQTHDLKTLTIPKRNRPRKFDEVGEEIIKVQCNKCGKVMSSGRLETHMNTHHNADKFLCKICNKRMKTVTSFTRHKQMHTGIKPFKCEICPQTFFQKTSLNFHRMEHTGERPAKCKLCPAAFKRFGDLRVHERRHEYSGNFRNVKGQRRVNSRLLNMPRMQDVTIVEIKDETNDDSMMEDGSTIAYEDGTGQEYDEETYEIDQHAIIEELDELNDQQVYEELIDYEGMIVINKDALESSMLRMT